MSRRRPKKSGKRTGGRRVMTVLLLLLIGLFAVSIYLGRREAARAAPPVRHASLDLPPPIVPGAGSPTLVIQNGCGRAGLGSEVSRWIRRQGIDVFETGNADRADYPRTLVVARSSRAEAARQVADLLQRRLGVGLLIQQRVKVPEADVLLILGGDFPDSLPVR